MSAASRRLLVTADDLGLHPDIDAGILEAHLSGPVGCASLVACGEAFEHALGLLAGAPRLAVAVHLTLVEERPVSPPAAVPSLTGADGRFPRGYREFVGRYLAGRVRAAEVARELRAQVERVLAAGLRPVHLNGHQHLHLLPGLWELALSLAEEYGIRTLRLSSFQRVWGSPAAPFRLGLGVLAARARRSAARRGGGVRLVPTVGLHAAGRLRRDDVLEIAAGLPEGAWELVTHPGRTTPELRGRYRWGYRWSEETEALRSVSAAELAALGVEVATF